jgi:hypothetical protein
MSLSIPVTPGTYISFTSLSANASVCPGSIAYAGPAGLATLQDQAPFCIGNGQTPSGVVKQFLVPQGATRLYIGIWDGYEYNNNGGSLSRTVTALHYVQSVR